MTVVVRQAMVDDSGLFTDGTAITKAFVDSVYDTIDDQAHSTTNPTIKPKATTDEVVNARGSKATLDARLDVVLNEDGTLKTQATLITAAQVQSLLGSRNVANNGDLADWTLGGALAPDNFTLTGAAAVIARTGVAMGDTFQFGTGSGFAAKVTRVGNDWKLTQDVIASGVFTNFANVKGQTLSVAVKGKTGIASLLRIVIDDGVSTDASTYHTGGGTEEHLSVSHVISNSATKLSVYVEGTGSNGDAYFGGFIFVFSTVIPSDWQPYSIIGDANATSKGLVTIGAQTLAGIKTFNAPPLGLFTKAAVAVDVTKTSSTAFGDVTGLAFAVLANGEYDFEFVLKVAGNSTDEAKFQLTGPAAPTSLVFGANSQVTPTAAKNSAAIAFSTEIDANLAGANNTEQIVTIRGYLVNGANAGTVQLQFAQQSSSVNALTIRALSFVRVFQRA